MATSCNPLRAAIYCRISDDREGERLGVERQREDCMTRADREGWHVIGTFTDNDISASTRSKKVRPDYRRMLKLVGEGQVDIVLSYSNSRLTRRPQELEDLIQLHEQTGVQFCTITSGDDDLSTPSGRMTARIKASVAANESEENGVRVARAAKQRRDRGLFHGGRPPYGYDRDLAHLGKLVVNPERAEVTREAARRILNGESLYGVWTDFNRRGIKTGPSPRAPEGTRWQAQTLKRILTTPATIGCFEMKDGTLRQVADPIIDRPTWDRLREILYDDHRFAAARKPDWSSRRKYALSGLLICGSCGHWLSGSNRALKRGVKGETVASFICQVSQGGCGKIRVDYPPVEEWVLGQVFARLDVPGVQLALSSHEERADDNDLRQRIADDERLLERLDDDHADGTLDRRRYLRQVDRIQQRLDGLRRELSEIQRSSFLVETGGRSLQEVWSEHDATWQRTLLSHVIEKVVVEPHPPRMATTLTRKRGECNEDLEKRRKQHQELVLLRRVHVRWRS
ncbi:recombinase family protein [Blastococcus sp. SYSU DS0533]